MTTHEGAASGGALFVSHHKGRYLYSVATGLATLALIFAGGLVTSTGSGLAVPDWPLSYGMLMPPMVGGIFYEHGHRMIATFVGLLTLALAIWTARAEPRSWVRRLGWVALAAVVVQGLLGGLTVIYLLPTPVSVAHACLAQTFFCIVIALTYATSREWGSAEPKVDARGLRGAAIAATIAVYLQLLLGALMRHTGAGLAIPDFPLAFGGLIPPFEADGVAVHFAHRIGALIVLGLTARLAIRAHATADKRFRRLGAFVSSLVLIQIGLGGAAVLTNKAVTPTTIHVATGAAILGLCWLLTLRSMRLLAPPAAAAP